MHIVVCIKQVPDSAQIRVHPVTNTIMRQGVPAIVNPYDLFALEEALRLKDKFGGKVTVLNGAEKAEAPLKSAGSNKLEAKGVKLVKGTKVVALITTNSKKTVTVRFTVK